MFYTKLAKILNSAQSRSLVLHGNIYDLFFDGNQYVQLIPYLNKKLDNTNLIKIVYELNGPVRLSEEDKNCLKNAWLEWKTGFSLDSFVLKNLKNDLKSKGPTETDKIYQEFDQLLKDSIGNPTMALEFLRQLSICSRKIIKNKNLIILIEAADLLLPEANVSSLNDKQIHRISIVTDWISDPEFQAANDTVCFISESRSLINSKISKLPQILTIEIGAPNTQERKDYIEYFCQNCETGWSGTNDELAMLTAGLSLQAIQQMLKEAKHSKQLNHEMIVSKVEEFIKSQLGDDVVEFKKPTHKLNDCVGFSKLKRFIESELIPRFKAEPEKALSGAAVAGAIGGGKTYLFEAVASELNMPVLVLKNLRSQWFGQTDVIFESLKRVLEALDKVCIFVDEADVQFGGIGDESHSTEKRLTGKIQAMMSDPKLKGRIIWLLMTARIHKLSPDIRRPGRVGDLIIPVLDPEGEDRIDFIKWAFKGIDCDLNAVDSWLPKSYSAADFSSLKSYLKSRVDFSDLKSLVEDIIPPAITDTRKYQTLQALVNCTRKSLLPVEDFSNELVTVVENVRASGSIKVVKPITLNELRQNWAEEIIRLESKGIK